MSLIERLILHSDDADLLGGLVWRAPSAGQSRIRALREARSLMPDASHYAQSKVDDHIRYGLYQPRASEEGAALPKAAVAAAACFSSLVGNENRNAALVLTVPAAAHRREERLLVVCLEDGVPVVDVLCNEVEARNALGVEDRPIWSDNPVAYPNCRPASFDWLILGAQRPTRLTRIPPNPWPAVATACAAATLAGAWVISEHVEATRRAREDAERAQAADPTPRYLSALRSMRPRMSADRTPLLTAVEGMFAYPLAVQGWMLRSAECSTARSRCVRRWIREGGTFDDLRRAVPGDEIEVPSGGATPSSSLDVATTFRHWEFPRHPMGDGPDSLRTSPAELSSVAPQLQRWRTGHVAIDFKNPTLWPRVEDLPAAFRHPQALVAGDVSMRDVPGPFILEALRDSPPFISWEDVEVDVQHGVDAAGTLKFSATGVFYAIQ